MHALLLLWGHSAMRATQLGLGQGQWLLSKNKLTLNLFQSIFHSSNEVFLRPICLFICLSVSKIRKKNIGHIRCNIRGWIPLAKDQSIIYYILVVIRMC